MMLDNQQTEFMYLFRLHVLLETEQSFLHSTIVFGHFKYFFQFFKMIHNAKGTVKEGKFLELDFSYPTLSLYTKLILLSFHDLSQLYFVYKYY